jgi:hypothetical protein
MKILKVTLTVAVTIYFKKQLGENLVCTVKNPVSVGKKICKT